MKFTFKRKKKEPKPPLIQRIRDNKIAIVIMILWFVLLLGIRLLLREELHSVIGGVGAMLISFLIIFILFRQTRLKHVSKPVKETLRKWYTRKAVGLVTIYVFISYGWLYIGIETALEYHADEVNFIAGNFTIEDVTSSIYNRYTSLDIINPDIYLGEIELHDPTEWNKHLTDYIMNSDRYTSPQNLIMNFHIIFAGIDKVLGHPFYHISYVIFIENIEFASMIAIIRYRPTWIGLN